MKLSPQSMGFLAPTPLGAEHRGLSTEGESGRIEITSTAVISLESAGILRSAEFFDYTGHGPRNRDWWPSAEVGFTSS